VARGERGARLWRGAWLVATLVALWGSQAQAQDLGRAREASSQGRYEQAKGELDKLVARSDGASARLERARLFLTLGQEAQARQDLKRGLELAKTPQEQGELWTAQGELDARQGRYDEALKAWAQAQTLDPEQRRARLLQAELLLDLGRKAEAEALLERFADEYNDDALSRPEELVWVARAVWRLGYHEDANEVFEEATEADPKLVEAWTSWGDLFLEKYNAEDARECYESALKVNPRSVPAILGIARVSLEVEYDLTKVAQRVDAALDVDPTSPEAIVLRALLQLDNEDYDGAAGTLREALKVNPRHLGALTHLGAALYLKDDKAGFEKVKREVLAINPKAAGFFVAVGRFAARAHRYEEAIGLQREALKLDPDHWPAFVELGIGYTRTGDEAAGVEYLRKAHENDPFHARAFHMVELYEEVMPRYPFIEEGGVRYRFHRDEAALLREVVPPLAQEALGAMGKRYRFAPKGPLRVEVFKEPETFSIRSVGLPSTSPHGICFGKVVTARSPSAGDFNGAEVLWHELAHVFHLQMSNSRVPRWFTEGLAEFESGLARPSWRRELDLEMVAWLQDGGLLGVEELNGGFTQARTLQGVVNAYYQSTLVIEFIEGRWGFDALLKMLKLYGQGKRNRDVLQEVLKLDAPAFDAQFRQHLEKKYAPLLSGLEVFPGRYADLGRWAKEAQDRPQDAKAQARHGLALWGAGRLPEARQKAQALAKPGAKEPLVWLLAAAVAWADRKPDEAREALEQAQGVGGDGYSVRLLWAEVASAQGKPDEARGHLRQAVKVYPAGVEGWRELAALCDKAGDKPCAREAWWEVAALDEGDFEASVRAAKLEEEGGDLGRARLAWEQAAQIAPFRPGVHESLAERRLADGDAQGASRALRAELSLQEGSSPKARAGLWLKLALARKQAADPKGAREAWERARGLDPTHPRLPEVKAALGL
jgi:tetratricopeptide (TPR) repeat protein